MSNYVFETPIQTDRSRARWWKTIFTFDQEKFFSDVEFKQEEVTMRGKTHTPRRMTCYQGTKPYRYGGQKRYPGEWTPYIDSIKQKVEQITEQPYNFALINYYPDGESNLGWHSDDERDLVPGSIIASVSFGTTRDFQVRMKPQLKGDKLGEIINIPLSSGDLLTMEGDFQKEFKHCLPIRKRIKDHRINITFRLMA